MTIKSLIVLLEKRRSDIQLKFQETSGIYSAKTSTSHGSAQPIGLNISVDDRLRLFALENERLRALLKSINEQTETELQVINSALLELNQGNDATLRLQSEIDRLREERRVLDAKLASKELDRNGLLDQIAKFESVLKSEKSRSSELQSKVDSLRRELESAQAGAEAKRQSPEIDLLFRQRIQQLEKTIKELQEERSMLKMDNLQMGLKVGELQARQGANPMRLEVRTAEQQQAGNDGAERKIIEAIDTVKSELMNFNRTQKQVLEKINEEKKEKHMAGSQEPMRYRPGHHGEANVQRSVYRNFPQNFERDNFDPHLDLSLNLPADFDQYGEQPASNYKKLKQIVKLLTEKQSQNTRLLEEKTEKVKELKKANKELTREVDGLQTEAKGLKAEAAKHEGQLRKAREEADRLKAERERLGEEKTKLQKKFDKLERKMEEMRDSEHKIQSLEKQKELMMTVNNQRNAEIQSLLNELNDKQDALNQAVSRSQLNVDASQMEADTGAGMRSKYNKLKRLFLGLRDAYFQLQDEYGQLAAELDKEVKLRESILEDFLKRSDFFEQKITEFRDFHDRIIDVKRLIVSKKLDR